MTEAETPTTPRPTVSGVCTCSRCEGRTSNIYAMLGVCYNCGTEVLMLFRIGDETSILDCPTCGCRRVHSKRLATNDETSEA